VLDVSCLADLTEEVGPCHIDDRDNGLQSHQRVNKACKNRRRIVEMDDSSTDDDGGGHVKTDSKLSSCIRRVYNENKSHDVTTRVSEKAPPVSVISVDRSLTVDSLVTPLMTVSSALSRVRSVPSIEGNCDLVTFSLGFDDNDFDTMNMSDYQSVDTKEMPVDCDKTSYKVNRLSNVQETDNSVQRLDMSTTSSNSSLNCDVFMLSDAERLRRERLNLSRLKRDEFKRKLAERTSPQDVNNSTTVSSNAYDTSIMPLVNTSLTAPVVSLVNTSLTAHHKAVKVHILVDSRELNGAQV